MSTEIDELKAEIAALRKEIEALRFGLYGRPPQPVVWPQPLSPTVAPQYWPGYPTYPVWYSVSGSAAGDGGGGC